MSPADERPRRGRPREVGPARRLPVGAEPQGAAGTHFRVWAPAADVLSVLLVDERDTPLAEPTVLSRVAGGYYEGFVAAAQPGARYYFQLDDGTRLPDPASRFQPDGPFGPSEIIDPSSYAWQDDGWQGVTAPPVVYELHVGTFTAGRVLTTARAELPRLAALGVTMVEVMPVAEFPGRFGWGYDGVLPFAPTRLYGRPDDLRAFVDEAHRLGLAVILDVVYNHFGPDGCPMARFSPAYFAGEATEWGQGLNFDGPDSTGVREFFAANAAYWIAEFHFDGLRLDATQSIKDRTRPHILAEVVARARQAAPGRRIWIVGENEPQDAMLLGPIDRGGCGFDALWNDDWHHTARVALTGSREAYYADYRGTPQEFISAARHGFLFQGQWYTWQKQPRGTRTVGLRPERFVAFLENHDQVANSLEGRRLGDISPPGRLRALTAVLLLGHWVPLIFQGQEYGSLVPFPFFADHRGELAEGVRTGRRDFLRQFPSIGDRVGDVPDPLSLGTFGASTLDRGERTHHPEAAALHASLLALRRIDPAFHDRDRFVVDGAVLGAASFALRFSEARDAETSGRGGAVEGIADRLLIVNLGNEEALQVLPEPLLSAFPSRGWRVIWSSDAPEYGGPGAASFVASAPWRIPRESATVLAPAAE